MDYRHIFTGHRVIPSVKKVEDLPEVFSIHKQGPVILLKGNVAQLDEISRYTKQYPDNFLWVHIDLFEGIGKDEYGVGYLKRFGVNGIISVKSQLLQFAKQSRLGTIQRLFMIDSEAVKTGLKLVNKITPDAIEILPASVPKFVVDEFRETTKVTVLGGGLLRTEHDVQAALDLGFDAVTASRRSLWKF